MSESVIERALYQACQQDISKVLHLILIIAIQRCASIKMEDTKMWSHKL